MSKSFDKNEMFQWVEAQAALGPRRPGSPAGRANEDFIFEKLQAFGLTQVRREAIPITYWEASSASLNIEGRALPVFPIPYAAFTPPAGITAPLVFANSKSPFGSKEWKGKIVVTEIGFPPLNPSLLLKIALGAYDPEKDLREISHPATWIRLGWHIYKEAAKQGALGFVGILKDQPGGSCRMYAPYGFKEENILDKPLPGLWVSREEARFLHSHACSGKTAHLTLVGKREPAVTHNIVGEIPGKTDETIVLSTHHDSPFTSPVEDASGVAVVLALARHFAKADPLQRRLVLLFTAGHFYGSIGTRSFIEKHLEGIVAKTALEISIEHIALEAVEDSGGKLVPTGKTEPVGLFVPFNKEVRNLVLEKLVRNDHGRTLLLPCEGPLGDYPPTDGGDWYQKGVPVINYISNPVYLLTDDDALSWVARERLPQVAALFADLLRGLDNIPRETIGAVSFPLRRGLMKALKRLIQAKTTLGGLRPVH